MILMKNKLVPRKIHSWLIKGRVRVCGDAVRVNGTTLPTWLVN